MRAVVSNKANVTNEEKQWQLWLQELRKWVRMCQSRQPLWQVMPFKSHWFCPYCGRIGVVAAHGEDLADQIADHLSSACDPFEEIGTPPIFPIAELKRRALQFVVKKCLTADAAWQVRDKDGRWVDPYSTQPTDIVLAGKVDKHVLDLITKHLQASPDVERLGWENFHTVDEIRQAVVQRTTIDRVVQKLTRMVQEQDVWKVLTPSGSWICPYCRKVIDAIVVRTPIDIQVNLPRQIAEHLQQKCDGYRNKVAPATESNDLYNEAMGIVKQAARSTHIPVDRPAIARPAATQVDLGRITQVMFGVQQEVDEQAAKFEQELKLARDKQQRMLPSQLPNLPGLSFAVHYQPCDKLSGDFYDFIDLGNGNLGISIGDVTGHGVNAALVMGMCKKVMNLVARFSFSPAKSLALANEEIIKDLDGQTFVSMWYGIIDPKTGVLRFARAGHEPLLLYNNQRRPPHSNYKPRGMAVGLISGDKFEKLTEESQLQLHPGDLLLLYTDGIPEVQNSASEQFGQERIEQAIANCAASPTPDQAIKAILASIEFFRQGVPLEDDLTMLAFRYH